MESISLVQREVVMDALGQIKLAIQRLIRWNRDIADLNDLLKSEDGVQVLAANCMLIMSIGEGYKKIDRVTEGQLLAMRPDMPWQAIFGMRNHIAHGYFDIDVDVVCHVLQEEMEPLLEATDYLLAQVPLIPVVKGGNHG